MTMMNISVNGAGMHQPPKTKQRDLNGIDSTARRVQSKNTQRKSRKNKGNSAKDLEQPSPSRSNNNDDKNQTDNNDGGINNNTSELRNHTSDQNLQSNQVIVEWNHQTSDNPKPNDIVNCVNNLANLIQATDMASHGSRTSDKCIHLLCQVLFQAITTNNSGSDNEKTEATSITMDSTTSIDTPSDIRSSIDTPSDTSGNHSNSGNIGAIDSDLASIEVPQEETPQVLPTPTITTNDIEESKVDEAHMAQRIQQWWKRTSAKTKRVRELSQALKAKIELLREIKHYHVPWILKWIPPGLKKEEPMLSGVLAYFKHHGHAHARFHMMMYNGMTQTWTNRYKFTV